MSENEKRQLTVIDIPDESNLKERVNALFQQNPRITAKKVCSKLHLSHREKGHTIRTYLSEFRMSTVFGHIPSVPKTSLHCRIGVWNPVVFSVEAQKQALSHGWRVSRNRNGMLVFRDKLGSVEWFQSGTVLVLLRGASNRGYAKTLVCRAFNWLSDSELEMLCMGSFRELKRHWVFDVGVQLARFKLDFFSKTHGLTIGSDGSHPGKLEAEETVPLYLQELSPAFREFAEDIRAHRDLIEVYKKEAEQRAAEHSRSSHSHGPEVGFWRKFWRVMTTPL